MLAIATALVAIAVSLLVTKVAALVLTATGMNPQVARFQARSAFTGVGFTTSEAEPVVHHPLRRRVVMLLMLLGNAGIITIAASLILSFTEVDQSSGTLRRLGLLFVGLGLILTAANSQAVDRRLTGLIARALGRWSELPERDYARLLQLNRDYGITELVVQPGDWLAGHTLADLALRDEGVVVLGIQPREGPYVGAPKGGTTIAAGDTLILYGRTPQLAELDRRPADAEGDRRHEEAVGTQQRILEEQARD